jgi:hypothetical protein
LLQLARDSESHIARYSEAQKRTLELEAWVEALSRLLAAAQAEKDGELDVPAADAKAAAKGKKDGKRNVDANREYSTNAAREVAQNILREKRLQTQQLSDTQGKREEGGDPSPSKDTAQRKYKCQGALQLLKTVRRARPLTRLCPTFSRANCAPRVCFVPPAAPHNDECSRVPAVSAAAPGGSADSARATSHDARLGAAGRALAIPAPLGRAPARGDQDDGTRVGASRHHLCARVGAPSRGAEGQLGWPLGADEGNDPGTSPSPPPPPPASHLSHAIPSRLAPSHPIPSPHRIPPRPIPCDDVADGASPVAH